MLILSLIISFAFAESNLSPADQQALQQTKQLLQNPKLRQRAMQENESTKKAGDYVNKITGGNQKLNNDIYSLSADIMQTITENSGGDVKKMQQLMESLQRNPAALKGILTPEQMQKLKSISSEIGPVNSSP